VSCPLRGVQIKLNGPHLLAPQTMQQMHTEHEKEDALFREFNARSIEVYEWAVGRFEERWGRLFNNPRRNRSR
jgi:hypothetical protein